MRFSTYCKSACLVVCFCLSIETVNAAVIFVDCSAPAGGDGQSWATAYRFLQDALGNAANDTEIWVAAGTYKPDQSEASPSGTGLRTDKFVLVDGVRLYGGLAGNEDSQIFNLDDRNIETNQTILTGDLFGDDDPTAAGFDLLSDSSRGENSYHIFKGTGISDSTVIDGFTITGASAMAASGEDCNGGGLFNSNNSNPKIANCLFTRNTAQHGAAIYNYRSSSQTDNTRFIDNASVLTGGAIHNGVSLVEMVVANSVFENNCSEGWGGAICNNNIAFIRLEHCRLINNKAWKFGNTRGGAIANQDASQVTGQFCTFAGNRSDNEGGAIRNENSTVDLNHCILWDNEDKTGLSLTGQVYNINGTVSMDYTCVMGWNPGVSGIGNFGLDPLFVDRLSGDVHLQSEAGHWDTQTWSWKQDAQSSPCIDAGDPALWIEDEPLGNGGRINIGFYAGTIEASKTDFCTGGIDGNGLLRADVNRDCTVNMEDLALFASEWMLSTVQ